MSRAQLKAYAPQARRDFIDMVTREAAVYGLTKSRIEPVEVTGDTAVIKGTAYPKRVARQRRQLDELVQRQGFEQTMESMAYTWFNRFMAIRYMELHGYLDHGYRVLSHPSGDATPEILQHAERVDLPGLDKQAVIDLKLDGTKDTELYRKLIVAQCNALHGAMPFLFERIDDATELLLPADLLHSESVTRKMVDSIDEDDWREVEIVGWLYQFYISEKKDQVIGKVVKSEDIPAATQLFTPNWIVKYMLHNSLGAKWLATYPDSSLKSQMDYYIEPAEQDEDVQRQLREITPESLNPEEITLLDPACGSGHILVEAYELFKAIYQERGYRAKDIPRLVLEKNLYGLEIDERAAQLSSFALLMKARADDRGLFSEPVALNVCCIQESNGLDIDDASLKTLFHDAKTYGSLIQISEDLGFKLADVEASMERQTNRDQLFVAGETMKASMLLRQARMLACKYDIVVANPPYIGSNGMNDLVKRFAKTNFPSGKSDLFACFIERCYALAKDEGRVGVVAPFVWMFISSYEMLRKQLVGNTSLTTLIQLEYNAFEPACIPVAAFTLMRRHVPRYIGSYIRLSEFKGHRNQAPRTLEAINNPNCSWLYRVQPDSFRKIPGSPVAYWLSSQLLEAFESGTPIGQICRARRGLETGNNEKFIRFWFEVDVSGVSLNGISSRNGRWIPYNKGGIARRWSNNSMLCVDWANSGSEIRNTGTVNGEDYYFKEGITWSGLTSAKVTFRHSKPGYIFDSNKGAMVFPDSGRMQLILGFLNSQIVDRILNALNPTLSTQNGDIDRLPLLEGSGPDFRSRVSIVVGSLLEISCDDWDSYERSWDFQALPILTISLDTAPELDTAYTASIIRSRANITEMKRLEEENNRLFIEAYGLQDELTPEVPVEQITLTVNPPYRYGPGKTDEEYESLFRADTMKELLSYAIGCMMGRYSLDEPGLIYAHGGNQGFDASRYTTFPADDDGILPSMDLDWFDDDIANHAVEFIATAWQKEHLEENLNFLADSLDRKSSESSRECIRRYLSRDFYKDHLQTYKRRPIYWLFSSGKQRAFQCLVYLHRYNEGTLARMRTEYVIPLQSKMTARLEHLKDDIANATSTAQAKKLEKEQDLIRKQQAELLTFDEKLRHCADQRITLDLDGGVKVNYGKFGDLLAEVKAVTGGKAE
jgi:type II restriction/modification system DNA methylase subunit YeeA